MNVRNGITSIAVMLSLALESIAQENYPKYWITFTDKEYTPFSIDRPEEFLSARAIERRSKQGIAITEEDLPVDPGYLRQISKKGIRILNTSRWFNGALVELSDPHYLDTLQALNFVGPEIILVKPEITDTFFKEYSYGLKSVSQPWDMQYGHSYNQIAMLHGEMLHERGFRGEGMLIAILDAGYTNANSISSLAHIWEDDRVLAVKDVVRNESTLYTNHDHGTIIFSILAGEDPGVLIGTAPDATYALIRTEDADTEFLIEEYYWICGAEYADSIGADIINSSLVYVNFNDTAQDHRYSDLDGQTAPASKAASKAAGKGILIVNGAGNFGNQEWYTIGVPADADSILTVGATDPFGVIRGFSSRGPSYDGRIKPDVVAQGYYTISQEPDGDYFFSAGTSVATPIITGLAACLWQANPQRDNMEIIEAIRKSASQYFTPDSVYGYGIPDMFKADWMLRYPKESEENECVSFRLFPNPAIEQFYLQIDRQNHLNDESVTLRFYDLFGNLWKQETRQIEGQQFILEFRDISNLSKQLYILEIQLSGEEYSLLFSKR